RAARRVDHEPGFAVVGERGDDDALAAEQLRVDRLVAALRSKEHAGAAADDEVVLTGDIPRKSDARSDVVQVADVVLVPVVLNVEPVVDDENGLRVAGGLEVLPRDVITHAEVQREPVVDGPRVAGPAGIHRPWNVI